MRSLVLVTLLSFALGLVVRGPAYAQDRSTTSGFALGTGLGSDNVFFGAHVAYYQQLTERRLRVAAHLGGGVIPGTTTVGGATGGVMLAVGRRNRLVVDAFTGPLGSQDLAVFHTHVATHALYGVGLLLGWEWMTAKGFFMRANIGPSYMFLPPIYRRSEGWTLAGNLLSLGYKLW